MIVWLFICAVLLMPVALAQAPAPGVLHSKIDCQAEVDKGYSYALYLPSNYTPQRRWPIVYAFDPLARGSAPVEMMKEMAEKYGYILAGSNNSKNGPLRDSFRAGQAVWADTHARFSVDEQRRYFTGFSGGARVSAALAEICKACVAGVIAHGAGFHPDKLPTKDTKFVFYVAIGDLDFNYIEIVQLEEKLRELGLSHRVRVFSGGHQYATPEVWVEAFAWIELQAMKRGLRAKDEGFIAAQYQDAVRRAENLEAKSKYSGFREYERIRADFEGLIPTAELEKKISASGNSKEIKDAAKRERHSLERQSRLAGEATEYIDRLKEESDHREEALVHLRSIFNSLKDEINNAKDKDAPEIVTLRRTLSQIFAHTVENGQQAIRDKEHARAITFFNIVIDNAKAAPFVRVEKARALALAGRKKDVLPELRKAAEAGFSDPDLLEEAVEFAAFRETPEFRQIVEQVRSQQPAN